MSCQEIFSHLEGDTLLCKLFLRIKKPGLIFPSIEFDLRHCGSSSGRLTEGRRLPGDQNLYNKPMPFSVSDLSTTHSAFPTSQCSSPLPPVGHQKYQRKGEQSS